MNKSLVESFVPEHDALGDLKAENLLLDSQGNIKVAGTLMSFSIGSDS